MLFAVGVCGVLLGLPQPQRFSAEVDDAFAIRVNPAGLVRAPSSELRVVYGFDRNPGPDTHGVGAFGVMRLFEGLSLGASWERDFARNASHQETRVGLGFGGERISLGASFARIEPFEGAAADRWDLGLSLRPVHWLAGGFVVGDLGESSSSRRYDFSIAVRPLPPVTLSGRAVLTEGTSLSRQTVDFSARAEVEVVDGFRLGLGLDDNKRVFAQLGIDFGLFSVGSFGSAQDGAWTSGGELVWRAQPVDTLVAPKRVVIMDLYGQGFGEPEFKLFKGKMKVQHWGEFLAALEALPSVRGVRGIHLRIGALSIGWAKATEVRSAMRRVREAGLRIDCYLTGAGDIEYFVAAACDRIIVPPPAQLRLNGISSTRLYFGEALRRVGVRFEVERIGSYKTSSDRLTKADMSPKERAQLEAYMGGVYGTLVNSIAQDRGITENTVKALMDRGVLTATAARQHGLIDAVLYPDEVNRYLWRTYGGPIRFGGAKNLIRPESPRRWRSRPAIALIHVDAPITGGRSTALPFGLGRQVGAQTIIHALRRARSDRRVIAVVLRVDTPGGDAYASDYLAHEVKQLAAVKPVIASFGDIAASGGYYLAAPASHIFAEPTTLTGSIGIYSVKLDVSKLLERLGVGAEVLRFGALAGQSTSVEPRSAAAEEMTRRALAASYARFVQVVSDGRKLTIEEVQKLGAGRIFSGRKAKAVGLVDELGGLRDALRFAAQARGHALDDVDVVPLTDTYQALGDPLRALLGFVVQARPSSGGELPTILGSLTSQLGSRLTLWLGMQPLAMLPVVVEVD